MRRKALKPEKRWNPALFGIRNPLCWNPESGIRNQPHGIQNPRLPRIPLHGATEKLGHQRMTALVENQKRLFTLLDLHRALVSLNHPELMSSQNSTAVGIFSVLPANRTCADLQLMPLTRCKCEGFDDYSRAEDNSKNDKWLVEFALGTLNDAIQTQHL